MTVLDDCLGALVRPIAARLFNASSAVACPAGSPLFCVFSRNLQCLAANIWTVEHGQQRTYGQQRRARELRGTNPTGALRTAADTPCSPCHQHRDCICRAQLKPKLPSAPLPPAACRLPPAASMRNIPASFLCRMLGCRRAASLPSLPTTACCRRRSVSLGSETFLPHFSAIPWACQLWGDVRLCHSTLQQQPSCNLLSKAYRHPSVPVPAHRQLCGRAFTACMST